MTYRALPLLALLPIAAYARVAVEFGTEYPTTGWSTIPKKTAEKTISEFDEKEMLDEELEEKGLNKNYRNYLVGKLVRLSDKEDKHLFVRPAFQPYLSAFYGAHTYSYWVVDSKNRVIFQSRSDKFAVLTQAHHSMRDILVSQCFGGWCYETPFRFNGREYVEGKCSASQIVNRRITKACGID